jgi:hypothetical protein
MPFVSVSTLPLCTYTAARLKVKENQLVNIFGEISFLIDGLKVTAKVCTPAQQ